MTLEQMDQSSYLPTGPAESARVRDYADKQWNLILNSQGLRDKSKFFKHMEFLTNEVLGIPAPTTAGTSASAVSNSKKRNVQPQRELVRFHIDNSDRVASFNSLEKFKQLRSGLLRSSGDSLTMEDTYSDFKESSQFGNDNNWQSNQSETSNIGDPRRYVLRNGKESEEDVRPLDPIYRGPNAGKEFHRQQPSGLVVSLPPKDQRSHRKRLSFGDVTVEDSSSVEGNSRRSPSLEATHPPRTADRHSDEEHENVDDVEETNGSSESDSDESNSGSDSSENGDSFENESHASVDRRGGVEALTMDTENVAEENIDFDVAGTNQCDRLASIPSASNNTIMQNSGLEMSDSKGRPVADHAASIGLVTSNVQNAEIAEDQVTAAKLVRNLKIGSSISNQLDALIQEIDLSGKWQPFERNYQDSSSDKHDRSKNRLEKIAYKSSPSSVATDNPGLKIQYQRGEYQHTDYQPMHLPPMTGKEIDNYPYPYKYPYGTYSVQKKEEELAELDSERLRRSSLLETSKATSTMDDYSIAGFQDESKAFRNSNHLSSNSRNYNLSAYTLSAASTAASAAALAASSTARETDDELLGNFRSYKQSVNSTNRKNNSFDNNPKAWGLPPVILKDSIDLSGLTLERLRDLTGHY